MTLSGGPFDVSGDTFSVGLTRLAQILPNSQEAGSQDFNFVSAKTLQGEIIEFSRDRYDFILEGAALRRQKDMNLAPINIRRLTLDKSSRFHSAQLFDGAGTKRSDAIAQFLLRQSIGPPKPHEKIKHAHGDVVSRQSFLHYLVDKAVGVAQ